MKYKSLFRRHFIITALVVSVFIGLGFPLSNALVRFAMSRQNLELGEANPPSLIARWINDLDSNDRAQALSHIESIAGRSLPQDFLILDASGRNLSSQEKLSLNWDSIQKPRGDFEFVVFDGDKSPGPPAFADGIVKFPGSPTQYLYAYHRLGSQHEHGFGPGSGPGIGPPPAPIIFITLGSLLFSVLVGVGFALFLIFRSMKEKMALADSVISELHNGNMKARFPVHRMDELGQAMLRFNKMADEIEILVERLRSVEKSRMILLQDLAHDLRTPVASLKNLLATVQKKSSPEDLAIRRELLSLSQKEVEYFERLLEDLLVLAQVSEPSYNAHRESVSVLELFEEEASGIEILRQAQSGLKSVQVEIKTDLSGSKCEVLGDINLLRRLVRNVLENAYSFAQSKILVRIESEREREIRIVVQDDGPGLSEDAIKGFGERRVSRVMERSQGNRVSVGLGSVIMKTVAELHRGSLRVANKKNSSNEIVGAEIQIILSSLI